MARSYNSTTTEIELENERHPLTTAFKILTAAGLRDSLNDPQDLDIVPIDNNADVNKTNQGPPIYPEEPQGWESAGVSGKSSVRISLPKINAHLPDNVGNSYTWTIHWAWDQKRGEHVKACFTGRHTKVKYAIMGSRLSPNDSRLKRPERIHSKTLKRFSEDCDFEPWMREDRAMRQQCAKNGIGRWSYVAERDPKAEMGPNIIVR